eukprot:CAMPEP_0114504700 /NCGR_PEP_ID=MMETSP0109-20121206/10417_1 /TAXON_ID=29199 /ORGANISM="Chlorarachnion reptans, Strain CCCM449" /LENGTH=71 /DNA_ID=CAMNT_0001683005 /DNA_START=214 /DNA_END=429 /DNA_ORIENTATION=+
MAGKPGAHPLAWAPVQLPDPRKVVATPADNSRPLVVDLGLGTVGGANDGLEEAAAYGIEGRINHRVVTLTR